MQQVCGHGKIESRNTKRGKEREKAKQMIKERNLWSVHGIQKVMEERDILTSRSVFERVLF